MTIIQETKFSFTEKLKLRDFNKLYLIILHHRAGDGDVDSIHAIHKRRGFAGIGYHFYIRKDGTIYRGRPVEFIGAHCSGNNSSSIGICLEGDFRKEQPTEEQLLNLSELIHDLKMEYPQIKRVLNHRDFCKTICPAIDLKTMVKGVKKDGYFRANYK